MPVTAWIARVCEEFPCYGPKEAYEAWLELPPDFLEHVIEARGYMVAKAAVERAPDAKAKQAVMKGWALAQLAHQIEMEIVARSIEEAHAG